MQIVIIGSGNVAYHLAKAFVLNNIPLTQIFGRNEAELHKISEELNIPYSTEKLEDANLYIICVSDSSVENVSKLITKKDCLVVHTSGSLPKEILVGEYRKSSFYPLQTFSKSKELDYKKIPFFIETENEEDKTLLFEIASKISNNVMESTHEKRKYIHLTAVFACNFVNHLFSRAKEISDSQEIPFDYFLPLIDETVQKIHEIEPKSAQTGPAIRNDARILQLHEELLKDESLEIYKTMNHSIKKCMSYKEKLKDIKAFVFDVDGVFTDGSVYLMPGGNMSRVMNVLDGYAVVKALKNNYLIGVITGGNDEMVKHRINYLGIHDYYSKSHNKMVDFEDFKKKYNLKNEEILTMGDDLPDIRMMETSAIATCPENAVPEVKGISDYISPKQGGSGAVRDVIEQVMKIQGTWLEDNTQSI